MNRSQKTYLKWLLNALGFWLLLFAILIPMAALGNFLLLVAPIAFLNHAGWEHPVLTMLGIYAVVIAAVIFRRYMQLKFEG